jgi:hypothetical protein
VVSIARALDDAWRNVFAFSLSGQISPDRPLRPRQVSSFLRHPKPDLTIPGVSDYYAVMLELGVIEGPNGQQLWPGSVAEYGYAEATHVIHERLNMTLHHLADIAGGKARELFLDEELDETMMVLKTVQRKYQGERAELPWYFDHVAPNVPEDVFVTYQF